MGKKVLIIGGGMAGLAAGSYLRMNGYDTNIYELNSVPGGVCTSWQRGDYTIDLCIHWLVGTNPNNSFHQRWNELLNWDEIKVVDPEEYARVEDSYGNQIILYTNVDRLEEELLEKAPEDRRHILEFTRAIRRLSKLNMENYKPAELTNTWERMQWFWKMLPFMDVFGRYMTMSLRNYASEFKNPLLQKAIYNLFEPDMAVIFSMMMLAWLNNRSAGYPIGGSLNFAMKIFEQYRKMGGNINFNARVKKIITKDHKAVGIILEDGTKHYGDYVVSAADGHATLYEMLEGKFEDQKLQDYYEHRKTFPSLVFVALGVDDPMEGVPGSLLFPVYDPIIIDPETIVDQLHLRTHNFDPTLAPPGKTLLTINIETYNYRYWMDLYENHPEKYEREKDQIGQSIIHALDLRFPGTAAKVEMIDISTPATFIHFSNNWKGSFEGWQLTPGNQWPQLPHSLPQLENFYMCGQWVTVGGGLPSVVNSGREVAQLICHKDGTIFTTDQPQKEKALL